MMICSCCGKTIRSRASIVLALQNTEKKVPAITLHLCKDCITNMYNEITSIEDMEESSAEVLSSEIEKALLVIFHRYCDVINKYLEDEELDEISYSVAKTEMSNIVNELRHFEKTSEASKAEYSSLFKSMMNHVLDLAFEKNDYEDIPEEVFFDEIEESYLKCVDNIKQQVSRFDDVLTRISNSIKKTNSKSETREKDKVKDVKESVLTDKINTPSKIKAALDKYIIGQEHAKKIVSVGIYNHYKRIMNNKTDIKKSNILLVGSTGSGKTEIARTVAKILDVPFAIADATGITEAGYVGDDAESMLLKLIQAADGDIKKAETGIIYIDEIDKIARRATNSGRDVGGEGVQQALLKIVEGNDITIRDKNPLGGHNITINTENILFISGGAFESLTMVEKEEKKAFGFNAVVENEPDEIKLIDSKDLIKFGMIPELVGRFPIIAQLETLTKDDLKRILVEPENSIVKQYKDLLDIDSIDLNFTDAALDFIATQAFENKTGARGLKTILENNMLDIMFDLPDTKNVYKIKVGVKNGNLDFKKISKKVEN